MNKLTLLALLSLLIALSSTHIDPTEPCLAGLDMWPTKSKSAFHDTFACPNQTKCDDPGVRDKHGSHVNITVSLNFIVICRNLELGDCTTTEQDVRDQMVQTNMEFEQTGIAFKVQRIIFVESQQYHTLPSPFNNWPVYVNQRIAMQGQFAFKPEENINVFVTNVESRPGQGAMMGRATFPWDNDFLKSSGGNLINAVAFGKGQTVLAHELGHNFGLYHTFQGVDGVACDNPCREHVHDTKDYSANYVGDRCQDTRATPRVTQCVEPTGNSDCDPFKQWGKTNLDNIMGYACMRTFTPNQIARAKCHLCQVAPSVLADSHLCPAL